MRRHELSGSAAWRHDARSKLLTFARQSWRQEGGFYWLDDTGGPDRDKVLELWINARMTYVFSLAHLAGDDDALRAGDPRRTGAVDRVPRRRQRRLVRPGRLRRRRPRPDQGLLRPRVRAARGLERQGRRGRRRRRAADRGGPGARPAVLGSRRGPLRRGAQRGLVARRRLSRRQQQHALRRGLPVRRRRHRRRHLATPRARDLRAHHRHPRPRARLAHPRALRPRLDAAPDLQRGPARRPVPAVRRDTGARLRVVPPAAPARRRDGGSPRPWLGEAAEALFAQAVDDAVSDDEPGLPYTTDWHGEAIVEERFHWVMAEAVLAAEALHTWTAKRIYAGLAERWWTEIDEHYIDHDTGAWHHELSPAMQLTSRTWRGKPDAYHAFNALTLPDLPLAPPRGTVDRRGRVTALIVGEALVDVVQRPGAEPEPHAGGSPFNVAVGLARLDVPTHLAAQLADDAYGDLLRDRLYESDVVLDALEPAPARTSSARATLAEDGSATYEFDLTWDPAALPDPGAFEVVHVGSLGTSLEPGAALVADLVVMADALGVPVSFDPNIRLTVEPDHEVVAAYVRGDRPARHRHQDERRGRRRAVPRRGARRAGPEARRRRRPRGDHPRRRRRGHRQLRGSSPASRRPASRSPTRSAPATRSWRPCCRGAPPTPGPQQTSSTSPSSRISGCTPAAPRRSRARDRAPTRRAPPTSRPRGPARRCHDGVVRRAKAPLLILTVALVLADSAVVTLALPDILRHLDASVGQVAWVLIAYNLVLGLTAVPAAMAFTRAQPRIFSAAGIAVFAGSSAMCAVAGSIDVLIAARCVQAVGGALALVGCLELLVAEQGERRGVTSWVTAGVVGTALGPVAGGLLTQAISWQAIFVVQVPIAVLAVPAALAVRAVPTVVPDRHRPAIRANLTLALMSAALTAALFLLVLLLVQGWGRSPATAAVDRLGRTRRRHRRASPRPPVSSPGGGRDRGGLLPRRRRTARARHPALGVARLDHRAPGAGGPRARADRRPAHLGGDGDAPASCPPRGLDDRRAPHRRRAWDSRSSRRCSPPT